MSRKIILIKQELLLLVYELNRSGLLAENEKIRPILAQLEKLLLCDLVNAGNGGFLHCIQMDTSVNAANQVVSVGADIAFDADPKFFACLVRFESSSVPTTLPTAYDVYPLDGRHD